MNAETPMSDRTSGEVQAVIDGLDRERAEATTALAKGEADREAIILSGDDKRAEKHDLDLSRHRRAIERVDLRLPVLRDVLVAAQAREAAAREAVKRDEAEAAIAALAERFPEYEKHAKAIADFCREWERVADLASDAGIDGPAARFLTQLVQAAQPEQYREESYEIYLDEFGRETTISHGTNPEGMRRQQDGDKYLREKVVRTRRVKIADRVPAIYDTASALPMAVNLPAIGVRAPAFWSAQS